MIENDLINKVKAYLVNGQKLPIPITDELLENYKSLIEQNAELKKRLANLDDERIFMANEYFDGTETRR